MTSNLAGTARRGIAISGGAQFLRQLVEITSSIVLARLLLPEAFGVVAAATTLLTLSYVVGNLGLGAAVIQAKDLSSQDCNTAFFLSSLIWLLLMAGLASLGSCASDFFSMPILALGLPIMSLQVGLSGIAAIPLALLRRRLQFGRVGIVETTSALTYATCGITLALLGHGVWGLIWAPVVSTSFSTLLAFVLSGFFPGIKLGITSARRLIGFGGALTLKNLFIHVSRQADRLIVAKVLGASAAGLYSRSINYSSIPDMRILPAIYSVCYPVFCRLRHDRAGMLNWLEKSIILVAVLMTPLLLGLMALAREFTLVLFGENWLGMATSLKILCIAGLLTSLHKLGGAAIEASGKLRLEVIAQSVFAALVVLGSLSGVRFGIEGVSWAMLAAASALFVMKGAVLQKVLEFPIRRYLSAMAPSLLAGTVMAVCLSVLLHTAPAQRLSLTTEGSLLLLLGLSSLGGFLYILLLYVVGAHHLQLARQEFRMLRSSISTQSGPGSTAGVTT